MIWSRAPLFRDVLKLVLLRENFSDRVGVSGLERHQRGVDDALVFAGEFFADDLFHLLDIEVKNFRDQAEDEDVFALVLGGAAQRLDRQAGDRHADVNEAFVVEIRLDVIGIIKQDAAFPQEVDVVLVAVLIKGDEEIRFVTGGEHFARSDADLEDRRPARNGGRNRHVSHDVLVAPAGEAGEESAGALDAVLRIAGQADDGVVNTFRAKISSVGIGAVVCAALPGRSLIKINLNKVAESFHRQFANPAPVLSASPFDDAHIGIPVDIHSARCLNRFI